MGLVESNPGWNRFEIEMAIDALEGNHRTAKLARAVKGLLQEFDEYDEELTDLKTLLERVGEE